MVAHRDGEAQAFGVRPFLSPPAALSYGWLDNKNQIQHVRCSLRFGVSLGLALGRGRSGKTAERQEIKEKRASENRNKK